MSVTQLSDRGVLALSGDDRVTFLNGLVSQDVTKVTAEQPLYGCLLTPQGKYAADFFIIADGEQILLDLPLSRKDTVMQRLHMFMLRAKVKISDATADYKVYAAWNETVDGFYNDPRWSGLGQRALLRDNVVTNSALDDYHAWRIQHGVPDITDFQIDLTPLLEANLDQLHGIAWDKGCYMGQELTARTHYRGLMKKRMLPFRFEGDAPAYDAALISGTDTIGHVRSTAGHYGMALVKMEFAEKAWADGAVVNDKSVAVLRPDWFRN
jgi:folate-binding protein YgfZ